MLDGLSLPITWMNILYEASSSNTDVLLESLIMLWEISILSWCCTNSVKADAWLCYHPEDGQLEWLVLVKL